MDLFFFLKLLFPGLAECAERLNPPPPWGARRAKLLSISSNSRARSDPHTPPPPARSRSEILEKSIFWRSFFRSIFRTPFFGPREVLEAHQNESKSPPAAPWGVPGRLRLAVSAENSIIPCIESTCASGVFWASGASRGANKCPPILLGPPFWDPRARK